MTFRRFLQSELERRQGANPRYSLRSFARLLGVDHSTLSQILRGKRRVTARVIQTLGRRLRVRLTEIAEYCELENDAAVLASIRRAGFQTSSRWIAVRLGIPIDAVNIALQRLLRTGMLAMRSRGTWEVLRG